MFVYDFPLSPKARTYLKFEDIFHRIEECKGLNSNAETMSLLRGLIDYIDLIDGSGAIKIDIGKDLDKLTQKLKQWQDYPEADQTLLSELLKQISASHQALDTFTRQRFQVFFSCVWGTEPQTLRDLRTRRWHTCLADVISNEIKHLLLPGR